MISMRSMLNRAGHHDSYVTDPDNDPVSINPHPDANSLFAGLKRAQADLFAAKHSVTDAIDAQAQAQAAYNSATHDMMKLFADHSG